MMHDNDRMANARAGVSPACQSAIEGQVLPMLGGIPEDSEDKTGSDRVFQEDEGRNSFPIVRSTCAKTRARGSTSQITSWCKWDCGSHWGRASSEAGVKGRS